MHTHVTLLVGSLRPQPDPAVLADLLLAPFAPSLLDHLSKGPGPTVAQIKDSIDQLLDMTGLLRDQGH